MSLKHFFEMHIESAVIFAGGLAGAYSKIWDDLCTIETFEGLLIITVKGFLGAFAAWMFKAICNRIRYKKLKNRKK